MGVGQIEAGRLLYSQRGGAKWPCESPSISWSIPNWLVDFIERECTRRYWRSAERISIMFSRYAPEKLASIYSCAR